MSSYLAKLKICLYKSSKIGVTIATFKKFPINFHRQPRFFKKILSQVTPSSSLVVATFSQRCIASVWARRSASRSRTSTTPTLTPSFSHYCRWRGATTTWRRRLPKTPKRSIRASTMAPISRAFWWQPIQTGQRRSASFLKWRTVNGGWLCSQP